MRNAFFLFSIFAWAITCQVVERDNEGPGVARAPIGARRICNRPTYRQSNPGCTSTTVKATTSATPVLKSSVVAFPIVSSSRTSTLITKTTSSSSTKKSSSSVTTSSSTSVIASSSSKKPSSTSSSTASVPSEYVFTGLYYHNKHRANHSAPAVTWNTAQAGTAAKIAASCVFQHQMNVDGGGYGQNLAAYGASGNVAALSPSLMLARSITNQWYYGEVNSFLPSYYGQATPDMNTFGSWGHFTQVVWKGSSSIGCASQYCPAGTIFGSFASWFTVCNYVPPGNYLGEFDQNVGRPLGQPPIVVS